MPPILSRSGFRAVLSCSVALVAASCTTDEYQDPTAGDNAFLQQGAPRYGAGGRLSPSQNPGRYRVGEPIPPGEYSRDRRGTVFLDDRRPTSQQPDQNRSRWNRRDADEQAPPRVTRREEPKPVEKPKPKPKTKPKKKSSELDPNSVVKAPDVEKPKPKPAPKPSPKPEVASDKPTATPVPGQTGLVYSPFDSQKRKVNVEGLPSGSEARCPYTKKIFRVP